MEENKEKPSKTEQTIDALLSAAFDQLILFIPFLLFGSVGVAYMYIGLGGLLLIFPYAVLIYIFYKKYIIKLDNKKKEKAPTTLPTKNDEAA